MKDKTLTQMFIDSEQEGREIFIETGFTPNEIKAQRDELLAALIEVRDNAIDDSPAMWGRVDDAIEKALGEKQ